MLGENSPVILVPGEDGALVQINEAKPEYGSIRFEQTLLTNKEGYLNSRKRVAFLTSDIEGLTKFVEGMKWKAGQTVIGRIRVEERRAPFYEGQTPKINPTTGAMVMVDNAPVYSQMFWDETGKIEDKFITGELTIGATIAAPKATGLSETSNTTAGSTGG